MLSFSSVLICVFFVARSKTHHSFLDTSLQAFNLRCYFIHVAIVALFGNPVHLSPFLAQAYPRHPPVSSHPPRPAEGPHVRPPQSRCPSVPLAQSACRAECHAAHLPGLSYSVLAE